MAAYYEKQNAQAIPRDVPGYPPPGPTNSKVRDQISALEEYSVALHAVIDALIERFNTVLTPVPPIAVSTQSPVPGPQPPCADVTGRLTALAENIQVANERINVIIGRAEV